MVVLGIGDSRGEHLADVLGHCLGRELQDVERLLDLLAADHLGNKIELLGGATDGRSDCERLLVADPAGCSLLGHQRLPFLSAAWPWNVRVGANSPSFIPTI